MTDPLCARCGATMPDRWHILARFLLPGNPTIGWCAECIDKDILSDRAHIRKIGVHLLVKLVEARGPGRVAREVEA